MKSARYCIGIDLGTTNCVLSYVDSKQPQLGSQLFNIAQWDSQDSIIAQPTLPSFAYAAASAEAAQFRIDNPRIPSAIDGWIPGRYACQQLAFQPGRVIHSAKSWLCHPTIDRNSAILPWQSEQLSADEKYSPVAASALYLAWLRHCWNQQMLPNHADADFDRQQIVITVPASFDEAAQQLTLHAAQQAGYPSRLRLIEEPQAAFYCWLGKDKNLRQLHELLCATPHASLHILVCDIGGGTTDLSLFEARIDKDSPAGLALKRLAVSDHLLLGGDNIDLALARLLEQKLSAGHKKLTARQWNQLLVQARDLKERTLGAEDSEADIGADSTFTITLSGSGSGLLASTVSTTVTSAEIQRCVAEGFFPLCQATDRPQQQRSGLKEWGLPYAQDSAVSRHLAAFVDGRRIDAVLFNGGTVTPLRLRQRLHQLLCRWQPQQAPLLLHNDALAMAVARGAARYGWILRQPVPGTRIAGGHAHALYLEVGGKKKNQPALVCILPKGLEAGQTVRIDQAEFDLRVNQAARFQCYSSTRRHHDRAGTIVPWNDHDFHPLPALQTAIHLPPGRAVANNRLRVELEATLNELGLLQLFCVERHGAGRWRLDFNLRKEGSTPDAANHRIATPSAPAAAPGVEKAQHALQAVFAKKHPEHSPQLAPKQLLKYLEQQLGHRDDWDSPTLRALWPELAAGMTRKTRSIDHESSWLYLAGFVLRPGYGVQLDDSRMEELWRLFSLGMAFPKEPRVQSHWYLLWRRVAGGLNHPRQLQLLDKLLLPLLRAGGDPPPEIIYLAGALERLAPPRKIELIQLFSQALVKQRLRHKAPYLWALGRLLNRTPLYAGIDSIVHPREVGIVFNRLKDHDWRSEAWHGITTLFALAARCTDQRDIDIDPQLREQIAEKMRAAKAPGAQLQAIETFVAINDTDREIQFGEKLPAGLILVSQN